MAESKVRKELRNLRAKVGFVNDEDCSDEENKQFIALAKSGGLPEGVRQYKSSNGVLVDKFYKRMEHDLSEEEVEEYLKYKMLSLVSEQAKEVKSIKSMVMFFVVLTVLNLMGLLIMVFGIANI